MSTKKNDGGFPENRPEVISRKINDIKMDQYMQYYCPVRPLDPGRAAYGGRKPDLAPALMKWLAWLKARLPRQTAPFKRTLGQPTV